MTALDLLDRLGAAGVRLSARRSGKLRYAGPADVLTAATLAELARHKPALLDLLISAELPADPETWRPGVRAVLLHKIEGGAAPSLAEQQTRREWREYVLAGAPEYRLLIR